MYFRISDQSASTCAVVTLTSHLHKHWLYIYVTTSSMSDTDCSYAKMQRGQTNLMVYSIHFCIQCCFGILRCFLSDMKSIFLPTFPSHHYCVSLENDIILAASEYSPATSVMNSLTQYIFFEWPGAHKHFMISPSHLQSRFSIVTLCWLIETPMIGVWKHVTTT